LKLTKKQKEAIKSYLRSIATATVTTALAMVADVRPELSILIGAMVAPLVRYLDGSDQAFGRNAKPE
jgi:hypothetical protein